MLAAAGASAVVLNLLGILEIRELHLESRCAAERPHNSKGQTAVGGMERSAVLSKRFRRGFDKPFVLVLDRPHQDVVGLDVAVGVLLAVEI